MSKEKALRNRTLTLNRKELNYYRAKSFHLTRPVTASDILNRTICQDIFEALDFLPASFIDLAFIDPPYNINKNFSTTTFKEMTSDKYEIWLDSWLNKLLRLLKPKASVYICGDWRSSAAIFNAAKKYFKIQNRITWEREKGRGAKRNWKNCSEDIWFCTKSEKYFFNVNAVKIRRKVLAPYRDNGGQPKDWQQAENGNYRDTHPSNIWTDLTVPFWSMQENTEHPTQKPEKLVAKIILASSRPGDVVFDPFLGSGTTSVVAKKLNRKYVGVEIDPHYCALVEKRLEHALANKSIQGYSDGVFWERNSNNGQSQLTTKHSTNEEQIALKFWEIA